MRAAGGYAAVVAAAESLGNAREGTHHGYASASKSASPEPTRRTLVEVLLRRLGPRRVRAYSGQSLARSAATSRTAARTRTSTLTSSLDSSRDRVRCPSAKTAAPAKKLREEGGGQEGSAKKIARKLQRRRRRSPLTNHGRNRRCQAAVSYFADRKCNVREGARMVPMKDQAQYVLRTVEERGIRFVQLWFTDVLGRHKAFHVTRLNSKTPRPGHTFDGSSIDGSLEPRSPTSWPDRLTTFSSSPGTKRAPVARVFCDIVNIDGTPFDGCPRQQLRRVLGEAAGRATPSSSPRRSNTSTSRPRYVVVARADRPRQLL